MACSRNTSNDNTHPNTTQVGPGGVAWRGDFGFHKYVAAGECRAGKEGEEEKDEEEVAAGGAAGTPVAGAGVAGTPTAAALGAPAAPPPAQPPVEEVLTVACLMIWARGPCRGYALPRPTTHDPRPMTIQTDSHKQTNSHNPTNNRKQTTTTTNKQTGRSRGFPEHRHRHNNHARGMACPHPGRARTAQGAFRSPRLVRGGGGVQKGG